jgi:hypothetical protein
MGYDFKQREVAQYLKNLALEGADGGTFDNTYSNRSFNDTQRSCLVKVGDGGLPKRVDFNPPLDPLENSYQLIKATCKMIDVVAYVDPNAGPAPNFLDKSQFDLKTVNRTTSATYNGSSISEADIEVVNVTDEDVDPGEWVIVTQVGGQWVYAGAKKSGRIRIALKTSIIDGAATAWILDQPTGNEGEFAEMQVTDPRKQFYGAIGTNEPTRQDLSACSADLTYYAEKPGGIGWASYSPTSTSWEIESMTLPIQRFKAEVPGGVTSPSQRFSGIANEPAKPVFFNPEDSLSPYPHVDMPPEVMCNPGAENLDKELMLQALNPHRFTIIPGSSVTIERRIKEVPASEYDATSYLPHGNAIPSTGVIRGYEWVIVDAEKTIARWARCKTKMNDNTCQWEYDDADDYKEGHNPRNFFGSDVQLAPKDDVNVIPAPELGGCECTDGSTGTIPSGGTYGWAFFDNNETKYVVVTTRSAMLGKPTGTDYIQDVSEGSTQGCGISLNRKKGMIGWACNAVQDTINASFTLRPIKFMKGIQGGCNLICPRYETAYIPSCGSPKADTLECMNIYADPCVTCTGTCNWEWNESDQKWDPDLNNPHTCVPDSSDCGCEGQEPPVTGSEQSGDQKTTPCAVWNEGTEPDPNTCQTCTLCENRDIQITNLEYTAGFLPPASYYTMLTGTSQKVGDCEWTVTVRWVEIGSPATNVPATISFDGTSWTCSVPDSPQGTQGNWIYTPPDSSCSPGILQKLDDQVELFTSQPLQATVSFGASGPLC